MTHKFKYCLYGTLIGLCPHQAMGTSIHKCSPNQDDRKNVVLILADDMGYECIGAYGSCYSTPNLDALASEGILYTMCHAQPLSTPTRVQLMTGKYNFRNYVEFGYMNPDEITFGNIARESGYSTCMVGKWQLGASAELPGKFGFDEYCLWQLGKGKKEGARDRYANVAIECKSKEYVRSIDLYGPDVFCDYARDFIERKRDEKFFLYYADVLVHSPFLPTPDSDRWINPADRKLDDEVNFSDMVSYMDKNIGKLIHTLKETGVYDDTVIIFIGDNGTHRRISTKMRDGRTIKGGKGLMTDAGTHVPMIVRYPSGASGIVSDALVDMTDFFPTIADIVAFNMPDEMIVDGHSLLSQFRDDANPYEREWVFCHYDPLKNGIPQMEKSGRFIRNKRFKLYHDGRLYDLENDIEEKHDLVEESDDVYIEDIRRYLQQELDKFPKWEPGYPGIQRRGSYDVANE